MLFKSSVPLLLFISSFVLIVTYSETNFSSRAKRAVPPTHPPRCRLQLSPVDGVIKPRSKRFVLFPEFVNYLDDWRYANLTNEVNFWIANFYPDRVDNAIVSQYIKLIVAEINPMIENRLTVRETDSPSEANFHFDLFDYTKCPMDDSEANTTNVQALNELYIYSVKLTKDNRYRAHGGINIVDGDRLMSVVKLNMQQKFLAYDDPIYDEVIYFCNEENECEIDLYWVLLHETLHAFGIEHTTNAMQPTPPNPNMQSVMHFSTYRFVCHDDIRAIRMIYDLPIKREHNVLDDTCRRDFPMSFWQKLMYLIGKLILLVFFAVLVISAAVFLLTLLYILLRYYLNEQSKKSSTASSAPQDKRKRTNQPRGYLWHDEML